MGKGREGNEQKGRECLSSFQKRNIHLLSGKVSRNSDRQVKDGHVATRGISTTMVTIYLRH